MKVDGDWGCGENCGVGNTRKWGPNSIYEKKHTCHKCGEKVYNKMVGQDCC